MAQPKIPALVKGMLALQGFRLVFDVVRTFAQRLRPAPADDRVQLTLFLRLAHVLSALYAMGSDERRPRDAPLPGGAEVRLVRTGR